MNPTRYAIVSADAKQVEAYLPSNYRACDVTPDEVSTSVTLIIGVDSAGWTLDDYVLPRLASGMHFGHELVRRDEIR